MGKLLISDSFSNTSNIFLNLMLEKSYDSDDLNAQLGYQGWEPDDTFFVTIVRYMGAEKNKAAVERQINSLMRMLIYNMRDVVINAWKGDLIILSVRDLKKDPDTRALFRNLVVHNPVWLGFSLPDQLGILDISRYYRQADYALERGKKADKPKMFHAFEIYAPDYLLLEPVGPEDKAAACMPEVLAIWKNHSQGNEMFHTLLCFLQQERSIAQTAQALFLHRNTAVYRIKKILEQLGVDLNNEPVRRYCYLSLHFLDAYERRKEQ